MKVALIHDHLAQDGGAEKVLRSLTELFPEATIYTLLADRKKTDGYLPGKKIETSIIQKLPGGIRHYKWYLYLMPIAVEFFDLREFDLVISDTSSFAKGVITQPDIPHICYCHTPTRYLWSDTHEYINELKYNKWIKKLVSLMLNRIRMWDRLAADRVDYFIANSKTVARRINKYYRRDSQVIYPPVETENFYISEENNADKGYFLAGCRLVPYKRIDIVIEAFLKLGDGYRLKIFGDGVDMPRLKKIAADSPNIEFLGRVSDEEKAKLYSEAIAFINPQEEDFGITPLESMASGRPVIAFAKGGATETVLEGKTGVFFNNQGADEIVEAVKRLEKINFDKQEIREWALGFSDERFKREIKDYVSKVMESHK